MDRADAWADGTSLEAHIHRDDGGVGKAQVKGLDGQSGLGGESVDADTEGVGLSGCVPVAVTKAVSKTFAKAVAGRLMIISGIQLKVEATQTVENLRHLVEARLVLVFYLEIVGIQGNTTRLA